MRVLHVITGLDAGGAEGQLAMVVERSRHDSDVVTLYNPGPVADQIRAAGTSVRDIGMAKNTQVLSLVPLYRLIREGRYDVVHTHLYRAQIYAQPAARLARTPVVVTTEHSIGETHIERRKMTEGVRRLYLMSERFSDATIAVSDVVVERLERWGVPSEKITMIPNGVDVEGLAFDPDQRRVTRSQFSIPEDAFVIGSLGRLDPNKRVELLLQAAAPLLGPQCKVLIIGRGEELDRLTDEAARLGIAEHVVFGGFQSDTPSMLAAFDLFVTTSRQETFGLSVLEALGSGLPALYTTCPALDGIATERARRVEGSVEALRAALQAEADAPRDRVVPTEVFDRYGIDAVVERIDDLYEAILLGGPPRRRRVAARRADAGPAPRPAPGSLADREPADDVTTGSEVG